MSKPKAKARPRTKPAKPARRVAVTHGGGATERAGGGAGYSVIETAAPKPRSPRPTKGRTYRRNVVAMSGFYDSSSRGGPGRFAFTAADSRRSMESLQTSSGSANVDLSTNLQEMRERSEALVRNNGIAAGAIKTYIDSAIGPGLTYQSRIDRDYLGLTAEQANEWQKKAERLWNWYSATKRFDAAGRLTDGEQQRLVCRSKLVQGDVFALRVARKRKDSPLTFALQLVEAARVYNRPGVIEGRPNAGGGYTTQGVEVGADGAPIAYTIAKHHPGGFLTAGLLDFSTVKAMGDSSGEWLVLHVGNQERVDQARGIPLLSPITEDLHQIKELGRITLQREAVAALFTAFVTSPGGQGLADEETTDADSSHPEDYHMGPGAILDLAPEETVTFADPKGAPSSFEMFMNCQLAQAGPAIGIPFEILTKRFQSSYSAARGAQLEYWRPVLVLRQEMVDQLQTPKLDGFLADCVANGLLDAPGFFDDPMIRQAYCGAEWPGPVQGQLDPLKSVQAAKARVEMLISNLHRETIQETGEDFETVYATRVEEVKRQRADGLDVEATAERIRTEPQSPVKDPNVDPDAEDKAEKDGEE